MQILVFVEATDGIPVHVPPTRRAPLLSCASLAIQ